MGELTLAFSILESNAFEIRAAFANSSNLSPRAFLKIPIRCPITCSIRIDILQKDFVDILARISID